MTARLLSVDEAAAALEAGGVVAVPTDTVYGVAALLGDPIAVDKLFALKRRPSSTPLPILVASMHQISHLGVMWPQPARRLAEAFWPGPLTIVVHVPEALAQRVGSAVATAGFRIPDDDVLRDLLERCGPLCVSSANEHGQPPCTSAADVAAMLGDRIELGGVVDDGDRSGEVSTVVDVSLGEWCVRRAGAVSEGVLRAILG